MADPEKIGQWAQDLKSMIYDYRIVQSDIVRVSQRLVEQGKVQGAPQRCPAQ